MRTYVPVYEARKTDLNSAEADEELVFTATATKREQLFCDQLLETAQWTL